MAGSPTAHDAGFSCIMTKSDNSSIYTCVFSNPFLSPPPPPPPRATSSQGHVAPFLIATVCILGISFLLLTTCTIILRRRRGGNPRVDSPETGHGGDDFSVVDHPIWHITTVGLQQSVIDSITTFKYKKLDNFLTQEGSDCTVCLTEFEEGDDLRLLPKCTHAFHVTCIDTWLRSHKNCPLCRAPVVSGGFTGGIISVGSGHSSNDLQDLPLQGSESEASFGENSVHGENDFGELSLERVRIAEILKKNREFRIFSDPGVNYGFRRVDEEGEDLSEPIRRSFSFNVLAASTICGESSKGNEGGACSNGGGIANDVVGENVGKRGTSMSGLLTIKSCSFGRSLQKGPVSMKRSLSTGGKLFSFRRTKSQASILPL